MLSARSVALDKGIVAFGLQEFVKSQLFWFRQIPHAADLTQASLAWLSDRHLQCGQSVLRHGYAGPSDWICVGELASVNQTSRWDNYLYDFARSPQIGDLQLQQLSMW